MFANCGVSAVQQERNGTVVDELDLHRGAEDTGLDVGDAEVAEGLDEGVVEGLGELPVGRRRTCSGGCPWWCRRRG